MSTRTRVVAFVVGLAVLFGAAYLVGGLFDDDPAPRAAGGYDLDLTTTAFQAGAKVPVAFKIVDAEQRPVTGFAVRHTKKLHLIAVSKDFARFRHVHPVMAADGTWSIDLALDPGDWRLFADFQPDGGENQVVDRDITVAGEPVVTTDVEPHSVAGVDGYQVAAIGDLVAGGQGAMLEFEVRRNGRPVTDLQPYLGAYGHLVVLRESDMQYLHVHPEGGMPSPRVRFHVEVPTAGTYYLYLDFKVAGTVHTAAVVLGAAEPAQDKGDHGGMGDMGDMGGMDHGDH